ncbi:MAG: hypothetical protein M3261_07965, partial [Thermoproteota archaeon]|nr:hypothetical protein [Thermoproteota archaeon]
IFYADRRMVEVRVNVIRPRKRKGDYSILGTAADPNIMSTPDWRLSLSPEDRGKAHFAAIKYGGVFFVFWDLEDNSSTGTEGRLLRIKARPNKAVAGSAPHDEERQFELAIEYAATLVKSAERLRTLLVGLRDGKRADQAGDMSVLWNALTSILQYVDDPVTEVPRLSVQALKPNDLKMAVLETFIHLAKAGLGIRPGKEEGAETKKRARKATVPKGVNDERKRMIMHAMLVVFEKAMSEVGEMRALERVTKVAVSKALGQSRKTLYNWLKQGRMNFKRMKDKVIEDYYLSRR